MNVRSRLTRIQLTAAALASTAFLALPACASPTDETEIIGGIERKVDTPLDSVPGANIEYGVLETSDGSRLRTIFSSPEDSDRKRPAIYFIQWLSCSTIELRDDDGWTQMLTDLIGKSGYAVMRTEKSGVGDSEGPACSELDYDTEVQHHREALRALLQRNDIDSNKVFVFGGSMGANQAPLVIDGLDVAGVIVWGGGAKTWYERMLGFDRRSLEFTADDPSSINDTMAARARFHTAYLLDQRSPTSILEEHPTWESTWTGMIGTSETQHYGRPFAFHHQAQRADWPGAWAKVEVPVLVLYGEYDWVEDVESHRWITEIVNRNNPGTAELRVLPATDHHFSRFASRKAAFDGEGGEMIGDEAAALITAWVAEKILR